jgi:hypothetical protein
MLFRDMNGGLMINCGPASPNKMYDGREPRATAPLSRVLSRAIALGAAPSANSWTAATGTIGSKPYEVSTIGTP